MQSETLKSARVAAFLNRSALGLLMLPVACFFWALNVYPPQDACWMGFALAIYIWPLSGILFLVSAGFHVPSPKQQRESDAALREAHGH